MDPLKYAVYDGRQLALKVSANSVYGFIARHPQTGDVLASLSTDEAEDLLLGAVLLAAAHAREI